MNIATLTATGLTQHELGLLFGVTRVTVNGWFRGRFKPHALSRERVAHVARALEHAVATGVLPLPHNTPRKQRVATARELIFAPAQQ